MWQYIDYSPELYHHGILGQKWGIRRYQYADGTLTPAGRKRYRVDSEGNLVEKTKQERKADAKAARAQKAEEHRQNRLAREQETLEKKKERVAASRDPQMIYENKDLFSYQELNDLYNIMQKEKQIKDMIPKGETFMDKLNKTSKNLGDVSNAIENGTKFYNSIAKVSNSLLGTDLPKIEENKDSKKEKIRKEAKKEAEYQQNLYLIEQNKKNRYNVEKEMSEELARQKAEAKKSKKQIKAELIEKAEKERIESIRDEAAKEATYWNNLANTEQNKKKYRDIKAGVWQEQQKKKKEDD